MKPDMVEQTGSKVLRSVIQERKARLEKAVEEYLGSQLYDWLPALMWYTPVHVELPPPVGIDLSPIVVYIGEWELFWPYLAGPTAVLVRAGKNSPRWKEHWWYTDLLLPYYAYNHRGRNKDWSSRFPKDLLPPRVPSRVDFMGEERLAPLSFGPSMVTDLHGYRQEQVAKLLELYDRVTQRYLEAIPRVKEFSRKIFEEEREFVNRVTFLYVAQKMKDV